MILENLGVDDYGIYSLVAGVIAMLAFIQNNLSRTIQRFLNYYHGKNDTFMIRGIFINSLIVQFGISFILCFSLYALTDVIFSNLLNIEPDKIYSAKCVYYFMLVSLFFNLVSTPFYATLIAHENIVFSSLVQIIDSALKIPIAVSLFYITGQKLEWYAGLISALTVLNFILYYFYSIKKYPECQNISLDQLKVNWKLLKEMGNFIVWTIYGTFCVVGRTQGIAIILNRFYGTAINAAYGIANQVVGQLSFLSASLTTAINPQIIKSEGANNRERMFRLAETSAKFSLLLISIMLIPVFTYMDTLLSLWLKTVPPHATMFCRMMIIVSLIDWSTQNLNAVNSAVGNVRNYTVIINTITLLTLPAAIAILHWGGNAFDVMIAYAVFTAFSAVSRLVYLHYNVKFPLVRFIRNVIVSAGLIILLNYLVCRIFSMYLDGWWFIASGFSSFLITVILTYKFCLTEEEKIIVDNLKSKFVKKC
ncbi:MAG: MATE family efflux transporter [Muribaculum sp.]|nr:MATE family efflux transporter [Muribaculum sp.]